MSGDLLDKKASITDLLTIDRGKSSTLHVKSAKSKKSLKHRMSAAHTITPSLMSKEEVKRVIERRSSFSKEQKPVIEDIDINEFHCGGNNDLIEKMNKFVEEQWAKRTKGVGRIRLKRLWKRARGKELDEEQEKEMLRRQFILEHISEEQKELFLEELKEMEHEEDDNDAEANNPKFEIIPRILGANQGTCKCQILRSSDNWSTGIKSTECSILNAYLDLIQKSKHFIYIENQFFISNPGKGGIVKNQIAKALKERIFTAWEKDENFKIIVFIPLLPGFEGDVLKSDSAVLKTQIKYQQETISKGKNSLYELLKKEGIDPDDYIRFYGLRQHGMFSGVPKHEIIYIHSKLMIVDDRFVICGSANVNDRSMLGCRDSEIAVLIEDEDVIETKMGGEPFMVGRMPHYIRTEIYKGEWILSNLNIEHFGADKIDEVADPIDSKFFKIFEMRAKRNSEIYRDIFRAEPCDFQTSFKVLKKDRKEFKETPEEEIVEKYHKLSKEIKGHFVEYPLFFLKDSSLSLKLTDKEKLVPAINFV